MQPALSWFSIPAIDFDRAVRFYEEVLAISLTRETMGERRMGMFPGAPDAPTGGAVCTAPQNNPPGAQGPMIYLNGGDDLAIPLARVEDAGGAVLVPKTVISPEIGYLAIIRDTEGNQVGLYSMH